jgi:hypothetical protein
MYIFNHYRELEMVPFVLYKTYEIFSFILRWTYKIFLLLYVQQKCRHMSYHIKTLSRFYIFGHIESFYCLLSTKLFFHIKIKIFFRHKSAFYSYMSKPTSFYLFLYTNCRFYAQILDIINTFYAYVQNHALPRFPTHHKTLF